MTTHEDEPLEDAAMNVMRELVGPYRPTQSEQIGELAKALAAAQGEMDPAARSSANPFFKSKYADLAAVWDACREPLAKHDLAVIQTTEAGDPQVVTVVTTLAHSSGQWIRGALSVKPVKGDPQSLGSALTYARRYALAAICGVAPEGEDDDAEAAVGRSAHGTTNHHGSDWERGEAQGRPRTQGKPQDDIHEDETTHRTAPPLKMALTASIEAAKKSAAERQQAIEREEIDKYGKQKALLWALLRKAEGKKLVEISEDEEGHKALLGVFASALPVPPEPDEPVILKSLTPLERSRLIDALKLELEPQR